MNKKIILCVIIVITFLISVLMCTVGVFGTSSLPKLKEKTDNYKAKQAMVEEKKKLYNDSDQKLTLSLNSYSAAKQEYDAAAATTTKTGKNKKSSYYDLSDIWSFSKKTAKKQNVKISLDCKTSVKVSDSNDYIYANLEYKVAGEYKPVIDFMVKFGSSEKYDLNISKFKLSEYEKQSTDIDAEVANFVQATFIIKNVPLSTKSIGMN